MRFGEFLTKATIWISIIAYTVGCVVFASTRCYDWVTRWAWTLAVASLIAHYICAFQFYHRWSHSAAYADTARQTAKVFSINWGGGVFINYALLVFWILDIGWWWFAGLEAYRKRRRWIGITWHALLLFIIFNATVVFENGVQRWVGFLVCLVLSFSWIGINRQRFGVRCLVTALLQDMFKVTHNKAVSGHRTPGRLELPFYYGWIHVGIAALAMVGTLPGRTQGLGLITEPLLTDLHLSRIGFARINLWATLIGALFSLGVGRMIDRFGSRLVLTIVTLALAAVVFGMSVTSSIAALTILITLTRGFGQSALSVVSITIVGQWFVQRLHLAMALYTVALSIGFMIAFPLVGAIVLAHGWRTAWWAIGIMLVTVLAPLSLLLVRRAPDSLATDANEELQNDHINETETGFTLKQALVTSSFWVFGIASAIYGLIASGIALFNESILAERGFGATTYYRSLVIVALTALVGNFLGGWLASKWQMNRLLALSMVLLALSLVSLPHVTSQTHVAMYAAVMGLAGGFVIVIFFSFWSAAYGRAHLGKIQGAAQSLTVIASAVGPLILAECVSRTGSYAAMFYLLSVVVLVLAVLAWIVKLPNSPATSRR